MFCIEGKGYNIVLFMCVCENAFVKNSSFGLENHLGIENSTMRYTILFILFYAYFTVRSYYE